MDWKKIKKKWWNQKFIWNNKNIEKENNKIVKLKNVKLINRQIILKENQII